MVEPLEIKFGHGGNSAAYQGTGWAIREDRGTWMIGDESTLIVPRPAQRGDYLLELEIEALVAAGLHDFQRLSIRVNGVGVCSQVLAGNGTVRCWLPWPVLAPPLKSMVILSHPDGWRPSEMTGGEGDQRVVSVYVRAARLSLLTERAWEAEHVAPENDAELEAIIAQQQSQDGHAMRALVEGFDSLGSNCELGMVQRHYGAEPLGLFRFSYTPLDGLVAALEGDLDPAGFAERVSLALNPDTREYELVDREHGFEWHSWQYEGQVDPVVLERQERVRLPYLVRRFRETLEDGEKILVLRDEEGPADPARVERLLGALRRHGTATLLWVGVATPGHAAGDVEWVGDGLMRGWIDRLTPRREAVDASMFAWGVICQRAHRMHEGRKVARAA